jgi:hypothetical protein
MVEEKIVEEIYSILVERFGISEVFLPRWGKIRPHSILWKQFIKAALLLSPKELTLYCGYSSHDNFLSFMKRQYLAILKDKSERFWFTYLCDLINRQRCSSCKEILEYSYYSNNTGKCIHCSPKNTSRYMLSTLDKPAYMRSYRKINKVRLTNYRIAYQKHNRAIENARSAKYRAAKIQASPLWADQEKIKQIYKECPEGYHLDHIVPLQGKLVCGLHCEFNLQYLTAAENLSKSNKFDIDKQE